MTLRLFLLYVTALSLASFLMDSSALAQQRSSEAAVSSEATKTTTVVLFIDGMRWDTVNADLTPNLYRLQSRGVRGEMIPVWPTSSSPNHWALATGLYPIHSGVYANYWYSGLDGTERNNADPRSWRGEPIWAQVANQGGISGVIGGWAGVQNIDQRRQPSFYIPYDEVCANCADLAIQLLRQPDKTRPNFLSIYFPDPDEAQHDHGVGSAAALSSIRQVDRLIGNFVTALDANGLTDTVDIVVVSDHGQMNVDVAKTIVLGDVISQSDLRRPYGSGPSSSTFFWPKPGMEQKIFDLLSQVPHLRVWRAGELPAHLHCCSPDDAAPIVALADDGWSIVERPGPGLIGVHGWDNRMREMHAVFIAAGPSFRTGVTMQPFDNVDVHALLAHLTGVASTPTDGALTSMCPILLSPPPQCRTH